MKFDNLSVLSKFSLAMLAFSAIAVATVIVSGQRMWDIDRSYTAMNSRDVGEVISTLRATWRASELGFAGYQALAAYGDSKLVQQAEDAERESYAMIVKNVDAASKANPADAQSYSAFKDRATTIQGMVQASLEQSKAGHATEAASLMQKAAVSLAGLVDDFDNFNDGVIKRSDDTLQQNHGEVATSIWMTYLIGLSGVLIGLAIGSWVAVFKISKPLLGLASLMSKLAAGHLDVEVFGQTRRDEIGKMAKSVQIFKDNGLRLQKSELESEAARRTAELERGKTEGERAAATAQQAEVVDAIAAGLERLSGGELLFRIDQAFAPEYEKLRRDFNGAMATLQETMKVVSANSAAIRSGTDEISSAADDLSRRTEQQAASLEETAAALDEITATVRKTAEGSNHAKEVVGSAKKDAEHSGQVVRQAVEAMSGIEKSAGQISQIIGVIDEIAFQTNLLALNAGVEAARAGDAGRGFAVVASEVRALAQRSAEAAKEIKALISASSHQVEQGVDLVGQTGQALERIVVQVAELNGIVNDIAASAQEQATGLDQVNTAVNQMDQVTQQNAAMVEQSTAASHALAQETEALSQLIGRFQVGQEAQAAARPLRKPAHPVKPASASRPVAAMKTTGRGGAARKPEPATDDGWQEF